MHVLSISTAASLHTMSMYVCQHLSGRGQCQWLPVAMNGCELALLLRSGLGRKNVTICAKQH